MQGQDHAPGSEECEELAKLIMQGRSVLSPCLLLHVCLRNLKKRLQIFPKSISVVACCFLQPVSSSLHMQGALLNCNAIEKLVMQLVCCVLQAAIMCVGDLLAAHGSRLSASSGHWRGHAAGEEHAGAAAAEGRLQ